MNNWDRKTHDFGEVSKGVILNTSFTYLGTKPIKEIEPTCNCVGFELVGDQLKVKWRVKRFAQVSYQSNKTIMIIYDDGALDDLTLTAYIKDGKKTITEV